MRFDIITIFPEIFDSYLNESILKRAREKRLVKIVVHNLRDFSADKKHKKVDDKPYGGGPGMVLMAEPILRAVDSLAKIQNLHPPPKFLVGDKKPKTQNKIIILSAKGKQFNQKLAADWAKKYKRIILVSGRYEGIDERASKALRAEEISIGPYVLTDGDVAAMAVISAIARLVPGVIKFESLEEESHWISVLDKERGSRGQDVGLEYPHYTRPEKFLWRGGTYGVPRVLLSGDHKRIQKWRRDHTKSLPRYLLRRS